MFRTSELALFLPTIPIKVMTASINQKVGPSAIDPEVSPNTNTGTAPMTIEIAEGPALSAQNTPE